MSHMVERVIANKWPADGRGLVHETTDICHSVCVCVRERGVNVRVHVCLCCVCV